MKKQNIDIEIVISSFLRIGMAVSAAVIVLGLGLLFITGKSGYDAGYFPVNLKEITAGVIMLKADAVIMAGLFLLIILPVARVVLSFFIFYLEKDYLYMKITAVVIIVLFLGMIFIK